MAGEIEESFSLSFQTNSLHSGSISFGRFENEPLSWERRSSFSHNKYLEEVEKCSKPGSVIEKKAYFEAHFKRKALLLQGLTECQNANEDQIGENDTFKNEGYRDGYENATEGSHFDQYDNNAFENADVHYSEDLNGNEESHDYHFEGSILETANWRQEFDYGNEMSCFANETSHFDESLEVSEYHGELDVMECEREGPSVLSANSPMGAASANAEETVCQKSLPSNDAVDANKSSKAIKLSPKGGTIGRVGKHGSENEKNLSSKSRIPVESKSVKPKLKSQSPIQKHISLQTSKTAARNQNGMEKQSPGRMKLEKQTLQKSTPARHSLQRSPMRQDSESSATKPKAENKSEKDLMRVKKVVESQPSASKKIDPRGRQTPNRLKQTPTDLSKPVMSPSAAAFSFKSDKWAERRKELYTKLDEKMRAKEAEMNQIQAKTQEKTQAEIRRSQKSLDFNATPMPSFYQVTALPGSDGNKAPAKIQRNSTSPGAKSSRKSSVLSKARTDRGLAMSESVNTADKPDSPEASKTSTTKLSEVSSAPASLSSIHQKARMKNGDTERKQQEKNPSLQKYRVSVTSKSPKDCKSEVKPKVGSQRNSNELTRKSMKGIGIGSRSGIGRLPVGVAS
ncbi:protein WVD2-like 7 isoform X2 [Mangifera indica]|uniref:protein WVD2-like 7 isoform X2 n=1 Tax=Mangifera indica TaxID=29780 RepID=UPI001CFAB138|nr:protein WVD2-like 7 isoform X2 [Mangifera indica]